MAIRQAAIGHVVLDLRDLNKFVGLFRLFEMIRSGKNRKNQVFLFSVLGQRDLSANLRGHLGRRERGM